MSSDDRHGTQILESPLTAKSSPGQSGCLILLHPPGSDLGRRLELTEACYVVGRDAAMANFVIGRDAVSRSHAELRRDPQGNWIVRDLGSTNGTFVNERKIEQHRLSDGDQVRFGDAIYKFLVGSNVERAYHEEIYRMTICDGLTGVHNKRYFLEFLERELASAHRHNRPLSLVMFDIDHFKSINDTRGHLCGDEVLKQLSGRIRPRIRREDLFARYGGEEFAAVLVVTELHGAVAFAESVRTIISREPFQFERDQFEVTVSLGASCVNREPGVTATELIRRADENLYAAKHGGRNRVVPPLEAFQP